MRYCPICKGKVDRPNKTYCMPSCKQKAYRIRKGYYIGLNDKRKGNR